jgi:hypothetical protein
MIKCPQCLQPRDEGNGVCPHCGEELYGVRCKPSQRLAEGEAPEPRAEAAKLIKSSFGSAELDFGDVSTAGLDLAEDPAPRPSPVSAPSISGPGASPSRAPSSAPRVGALEPLEARGIASFGAASPGPFGAVAYFFRVTKRRGELRVERSGASFALEGKRAERSSLLAEIGRRTAAARKGGEARDRLIDSALAAEARMDDVARRTAEAERGHTGQLEGLTGRLADLAAEIGPLGEGLAREGQAIERQRAEAKRAELAWKRSEIERRNLVELIAKRQGEYADPTRAPEDKRRLLAEITELDRRSPQLNAAVDAARGAFDRLSGPLAEAEARVSALAASLAQKREQNEALEAEKGGVEYKLSQLRERNGVRLDAERRGADDAFAAVGERALPGLDRSAGPLAGKARAVDTTAAEVGSLERSVAALDAAMTSFERDPYARGRVLVLVAAGLFAALLLVAVVCAIA